MIYTETVEIRGRQFTRTYSDTYMIERDGVQYGEAIDPIGSGRTYTESDTPLEMDELSDTEQKAAAYDILTGVSE